MRYAHVRMFRRFHCKCTVSELADFITVTYYSPINDHLALTHVHIHDIKVYAETTI